MNSQALASTYPYFNTSEISAFYQQFATFDKANAGKLFMILWSLFETLQGPSINEI